MAKNQSKSDRKKKKTKLTIAKQTTCQLATHWQQENYKQITIIIIITRITRKQEQVNLLWTQLSLITLHRSTAFQYAFLNPLSCKYQMSP